MMRLILGPFLGLRVAASLVLCWGKYYGGVRGGYCAVPLDGSATLGFGRRAPLFVGWLIVAC